MFQDLSKFEAHLPKTPPVSIEDLSDELKIFSDESLEIWYSPMGIRPKGSRLWILGITPGWNQMRIAYEEAAKAMQSGMSKADAAHVRKTKVAFAGSMRVNLTSMLEELSIPAALELPSADDLFESKVLRTGSILKYPVFKNSKNYTGHTPKPTGHPALKSMVDTLLADELGENPACLILPLGKAVEDVLAYCGKRGLLDMKRVLTGFPHPSGANGHRRKQFELNKLRLQDQIKRWFA